MDDRPVPRVSPGMLRRLDSLCPRRLAAEFHCEPGSSSPANRGRLRDAFIGAAKAAHAELAIPTIDAFRPPDSLEPEEHALFRHAADWYVELFGDKAVATHLHGLDSPTPSPRRHVRLGGWVDLTVVDAEGRKELRQLDLWGGPVPDDPLEREQVRLAILRLNRWVGDDTLRVVWADLVNGTMRSRDVDLRVDRKSLVRWFDDSVEQLRDRVANPLTSPGDDCRTCRWVSSCPEHPTGANGRMTSKDDLRPGIIGLSPSSLTRWLSCPRDWRNRDLLQLPASDLHERSTNHGQQVHALLQRIHTTGSCQDSGHVESVMAAAVPAPSAEAQANVARHIDKCPQVSALGHEFGVARFHRRPLPNFMATARLDAVWMNGTMLEARDYKTGARNYERVADDPAGRLQAWVLAPRAAQLGLEVCVRHEYLATEIDEDPQPFIPELEDLEAIESELTGVVEEIWRTEEFTGVKDETTCGRCDYHSICPDSASPGEPTWSLPPDAE